VQKIEENSTKQATIVFENLGRTSSIDRSRLYFKWPTE